MLVGLMLIVATGLLWCANAIVMSYIARKSMNFISVIGIQAIVGASVAWIFLCDYTILFSEKFSRLTELAFIMVGSGIICTLGMLTMQRAMQIGHHGIVFTISQSAMLIPFLCSVLIFGDIISSTKVIGIIILLLSFAAFGMGQSQKNMQNVKTAIHLWFLLAVAAFLVLGFHQSLTIIPSYWMNWSDTANLRVAFLTTGIALGFIALMVMQKKIPDRASIKFGMLIFPFGLPSLILFYKGIDYLANMNLVALAYPLAVSTSITAFVIYSLFFLHEKTPNISIVGVFLGIVGLMMISLS